MALTPDGKSPPQGNSDTSLRRLFALDLPAASGDKYDPNAWKTLTLESLRGHVVSEHFDALHLSDPNGCVARWDYEIALTRGGSSAGFDMQWVVTKACQILLRSDQDIQLEINAYGVDSRLTPNGFREALIKNLKCIELFGLATIDWEQVKKLYADYNQVSFNLESDGDQAFPHFQGL